MTDLIRREDAIRILDKAAASIEAEEAAILTWGGPDPRGPHARQHRLKEADGLRMNVAAIRAGKE
jgi:hypothetical protein